jgi:hypothetical protein
MKKLMFVFLLFPFFVSAQPSSTKYLVEKVFQAEIEKKAGIYEVDSNFLFELVSRAYPDDWYIPIKRNLNIYGPMVFGAYKFYLSETYQKDNLAIGYGYFFDKEGNKIAFSIIFVLDETKKNYYYIHFCQSEDDKKPKWEYLAVDEVKCSYSHSLISAGDKKGIKKSFY